MELNSFFPIIIKEFEKWFNDDSHKGKEDIYKDSITSSKLKSYTTDELCDFIYNFVEEGGNIQTGGDRSKNQFKDSIRGNAESFKDFILEPFRTDFDLEDWYDRIKDYKHFGPGIASIYLNRIDKTRFPVMNTKTLRALIELGFSISLTKNYTNYQKVMKIQTGWINDYAFVDNFFKADAINHFLIGTDGGKRLLQNYVYQVNRDDYYEQEEVVAEIGEFTGQELKQLILDNEKDTHETVEVNAKKYKRNNYLMALIKKYRNYECQFCEKTIRKADGSNYVEACHIKPKAEGGRDVLNNILVLCPNCHKLFDLGKKEQEIKEKDSYSVMLNKEVYRAKLC